TIDGTELWIQTTLSPIVDIDGNIKNLIAIDSDITEIKKAEEEISKQRNLLELKNNLITDSIKYAKKIQEALLPSTGTIKKHFKDSFVLFHPKDLVSGDFYWVAQKDSMTFLAEVDCTGHGVPGGFMSMIGNSLLSEIVNIKNVYEPEEILCLMHQRLIESFNRNEDDNSQEDGMDASIFCFNKSENSLKIACANQDAYFISDGKMQTIKGGHFSIGETTFKQNFRVSQTQINVNQGDVLYLMSDGYQDQFGGPNNKKFMIKKLRELLYLIHKQEMKEQLTTLDEAFSEWKGDYKQIDDILLIGIKF
ncbi:MAG: pas/pac sensor protein, partial [Marinilabiliales bacterium]